MTFIRKHFIILYGCNIYGRNRSGSEESSLNILYVCASIFLEVQVNKGYHNSLLKLAKKASDKGEIPVAAIIEKDGKVIAKAYNKKHCANIPVYHAEILAIKKACRKLKTWHLDDCSMYVTLEPCPMCYYAIVESRIKNVYYMLDSKYYDSINNKLNKTEKIKVANDEYLQLLQDFFKKLRNKF